MLFQRAEAFRFASVGFKKLKAQKLYSQTQRTKTIILEFAH